jgi:hypothetical protein
VLDTKSPKYLEMAQGHISLSVGGAWMMELESSKDWGSHRDHEQRMKAKWRGRMGMQERTRRRFEREPMRRQLQVNATDWSIMVARCGLGSHSFALKWEHSNHQLLMSKYLGSAGKSCSTHNCNKVGTCHIKFYRFNRTRNKQGIVWFIENMKENFVFVKGTLRCEQSLGYTYHNSSTPFQSEETNHIYLKCFKYWKHERKNCKAIAQLWHFRRSLGRLCSSGLV